MKLIKCYIENFGKLQNFTYNFQDGLNIIKEENGFGKTTFATFIKSMFYGLDTGVNVKVEKSDRKKYFPWQGGMYGGNIEFEINNKRYRIERFFGKKAADDSFKLYDLETNLESNDYTENIGEEIFKINKSAYERSTYIPQGQIQIDMEDSLSAKLGNVLESENDINTSEEALKKLNETKKLYKKDKGKGGLIDEKKAKLNELERKIENSKTDIETLEARKKQLDAKIKEIKQTEELRNKNQKLLALKIEQDRKIAKQETYKTFIEMYNQSEKKYNELKSFFVRGIPTDDELKGLIEKNFELERINAEAKNSNITKEDVRTLEDLKTKFDGKNITTDEIENSILNCTKVQQIGNEIQKKQIELSNMEKELNIVQKETKKKETTSKILLIVEIIIFLFGIATIVLDIQKIVGIILIVLTIALFIFHWVKKGSINYKERSGKIKEHVNSLNEEINGLKDTNNTMEQQVENILKTYNLQAKDIAERILLLTNLKEKYNQYKKLQAQNAQKETLMQKYILKKQNLQKKIESELSKYFLNIDTSYSELLQELRIKKNEFNTVEKQYLNAKVEKEKYESQNNFEDLKQEDGLPNLNNFENITEQQLKEEISNLNIQIDSLVDEKNQIKNQIEFLENKIDENEYLENDIENLKEEINDLAEKYEILKNTEKLLKAAKESFSSSYLKDMVSGFNKYLSIINNIDMDTNVDIKLDVKVDVNGSQKEIKYFSAGYKDLIYICMRFSLINALFKDESPFVVLDDPLVNLDEEKTSKALEVINEFAKDYQVIYFVCNSSRV